ncbi:hypothetical protein MBT84_31135 [Streptomyces sp. MBT84]|nr:hypothetical protein [Streptomyces sp. MBT84]REE60144.1 hypothetical protein BX257_2669 [Streptomyces sp. 3212.3]
MSRTKGVGVTRSGVPAGGRATEEIPPRPEAPARTEPLAGSTGPPREPRWPKRRRTGMAVRREGV